MNTAVEPSWTTGSLMLIVGMASSSRMKPVPVPSAMVAPIGIGLDSVSLIVS